jgi:hypothetical protein
VSDPSELHLVAKLRGLAVESPDATTVANRTLARYRIERKSRGIHWSRLLAAAALVIATMACVSYFAPAADLAVASAPFSNWILRSAGLGDVSDLVTGMSDSSTQNGLTLHLVGGYADSSRTVLLIDLPLARDPDVLIGSVYLQDQFGQKYAKTGAVQDLATRHAAIIFEPLRAPASLAGARLTLHIDVLESTAGRLISGPWELHGVLVQENLSRTLSSPQAGMADGHPVRITSVVAVPHGLRLVVSFPGTATTDVLARISDGSPKGRPAVILRLVTSSAATTPFTCEYVDVADGPGFDCLWLVAPGVYTLVVDYRGSLLNRQISVPGNR